MPVRAALLVLSRSRLLREALTRRRLFPAAVSRFIAGPEIADALAAVERLAARGLQATLNHLGEHVESAPAAAAEVEAQGRALERLRSAGLASHLSVKLTQLGLDVDADLSARHLRQILEEAATLPTLVRIDMEGSAYTDRTLALYRQLRLAFPNVGVVLQAYLYRTPGDLESLLPLGANVRLCKGAYREPPGIAYPRKREVDASFLRLAARLLSPDSLERGTFAAFATHDPRMVAGVQRLAAEQRVPRDRFEFQMLYGIGRDLQAALVAAGTAVRIYIPYGDAWFPYFMRRLAERPANLLFLLRSLLRG
ncbi:MAG TPA: proline dehydrogenase family protein [Candidatus Methylomirabilis sp.]|nr:proline dehydrogenase family protein [Candidatus Methylomirabilis sp.]